jgi:hypothetical protein
LITLKEALSLDSDGIEKLKEELKQKN